VINNIPPEHFFEMSEVLFEKAKDKQAGYNILLGEYTDPERPFYVKRHLLRGPHSDERVRRFLDMDSNVLDEQAKQVGHLTGLAWLAYEAGEAAQEAENDDDESCKWEPPSRSANLRPFNSPCPECLKEQCMVDMNTGRIYPCSECLKNKDIMRRSHD